MRLQSLFLMTALVAFSSLASAQIAEPFSPPGGLHPHQTHCASSEILGDNVLPQNSVESASLFYCAKHQA